MNKIAGWIDGHQLISYFFLSFLISWGLLISLGPLYARGVVIVIPILMLALFGPALSGIILSAMIYPEPKRGTPGKRLLTFFLTWFVATPVYIFNPELRRQGIDLSLGLAAISAASALIPAFIVSSAFSRTSGVRSFLESLVKPRGHVAWYIIAVLITPALLILSIVIESILGNTPTSPRVSVDGSWPNFLSLFLLSACYRFFYANACGEEPGWRGFALPRLEARFSPLTANLILAFFWAIWHLPLPQARGLANPAAFFQYYVGTFSHCILLSWLFNRTKGSVLAAGLLHVFSNVSRLYIPETGPFLWVRPVFCVLLIIIYRMWKKSADSD